MDIEMEEVDEFGNLIIRDADGNIVEVVHDEL